MPNGGNAKYRESVLRRHGQAGLDELRRKWAAKRRTRRYKDKFQEQYGRFPDGPDDMKDLRRMMRGHPWGCQCFECLWEPEVREEFKPRVCGSHYDR